MVTLDMSPLKAILPNVIRGLRSPRVCEKKGSVVTRLEI